MLKKHGLKAMGPLYVLDGEAEAKKKFNEYRLISRKLEQALGHQAAVVTPQAQQAMIQNLNAQIGQLRGEINAVGQQINRLPKYRGRLVNLLRPAAARRAHRVSQRAERRAAAAERHALPGQGVRSSTRS